MTSLVTSSRPIPLREDGLTNPPHPMWMHFESFHINQHPTYMSMYRRPGVWCWRLGSGLGHPWIGAIADHGAMCSALCWMLQGWLPAAWALFGGMLAVLRLGIFGYWINGYWCASVVALGGALVLGALPRLKHHVRWQNGAWQDAAWMALGLMILANSRPYEGLAFSLTVAGAMLIWLCGPQRPRLATALRRVVAPIAVILATAAVADGYYNYRVTGNPWLMPYEVNHVTYGYAPLFLFQKPRPEPNYHHAVMREFYEQDFHEYREKLTLAGFLQYKTEMFWFSWAFYLGPVLTIPLLAFPWIMRDRRMRFPLQAGALFLLALSVETWLMPHYLAPATGLLYVVVMQGMRHLRLWRWHGRGRA